MPTITLIRPGVYAAPQGQLKATPRRLAGWLERFNRMRADGIKIPVCWGHQKAALPGDESQRAENRWYASRFNAGYLDRLDLDPKTGRLRGKLDVPGASVEDGKLVTEATLPNGMKVKAAIGEVSLAINTWRDGKGRTWPDSIIHCALTPLPVVHGQGGFDLATETGATHDICPAGTELFTLSSFVRTLATTEESDMAEENEKEDEKIDEGEMEPTAEAPPEPPAPEVPPVVPPEPAAPAHFGEALAVLQELGLHLPPGTTPENLLERICVAGHAISKAGEEEEEEESETPSGGEYSNQPANPVEEQRPITMSTVTDRLTRDLLAQKQTAKKARLLKLIDRLVKAKFMPASKANLLRDKVGGYELSLTADGSEIAQPVDLELSVWKDAFESSPAGQKDRASRGRVEPRPEPREHDDRDSIAQRAAKFSHAK